MRAVLLGCVWPCVVDLSKQMNANAKQYGNKLLRTDKSLIQCWCMQGCPTCVCLGHTHQKRDNVAKTDVDQIYVNEMSHEYENGMQQKGKGMLDSCEWFCCVCNMNSVCGHATQIIYRVSVWSPIRVNV